MLKVLLVLALIDKPTGAILSVWNPTPGFETMDACNIALVEAYKDAPANGMTIIKGRCVDANELVGLADQT